MEAKATKYDEFLNKQLEDKLSKIPEDRLEFVNKVLDWKDHESKVELLDWFITDYTSDKWFNNKPAKEWGSVNKDTTDYQKAKEEWDISSLIANAKVVE